jgi:GNAT superfamily N-acetyltransferase
MKIIDAYWEKRNLGVETVEFEVGAKDSIEVVADILANERQYNVVKVPAGNTAVMFALSANGYYFVESQINGGHSLKSLSLPAKYTPAIADTTYSAMEKSDIDVLFGNIRDGLFDSDRIYNDEHFGKEIASLRYINWISDELEKGCDIYKLCNTEAVFGFFTFKESATDVYYPFLVGIYKEYRRRGLGVASIFMPLCEAVKRNAKTVSTYFSADNPNAVNLYFRLGYEPKGIYYVYVNHK